MIDTSPNLLLPFIMPSQAQKHVTHNEAIRALDALTQIAVQRRDLSAPPPEPAEGARFLVAASPSGAWSGRAGQLAAWQDGAWAFYAPKEGWLAWLVAEEKLVVHQAGAWVAVSASGGGDGGDGSGNISGPIVQALSTMGLVHRATTSGISASGGYDWRTYYQAAGWTNGPPSEPTYVDDVVATGFNMANVGVPADPTRQYAAWHMESKFYSNPDQLQPWTENFLQVIDTGGTIRRPIGWVGTHDGSYGNTTLAQSLLLFQGNDHAKKVEFNFETNAVFVYDGLVTNYAVNNVAPHRQYSGSGAQTYPLPYLDDGDNFVIARPATTALTPGSKNASGFRARTRGMNTDVLVAEAPTGLAATFQMSCGTTQGVSAAIPVTANGTTTVTAGNGAITEAAIGRLITGANVPGGTRINDVINATTFKTSNPLPLSVTAVTLAARTQRTTEWSVDQNGVVTYDYAGQLAFRDKNAGWGLLFQLYNGNVGIGAGAAYPTGAKLVVDGPVRLKTYTVAGLPSASAAGAGAVVYVSDASGGPALCCSDGTAWRVAGSLGAVVG